MSLNLGFGATRLNPPLTNLTMGPTFAAFKLTEGAGRSPDSLARGAAAPPTTTRKPTYGWHASERYPTTCGTDLAFLMQRGGYGMARAQVLVGIRMFLSRKSADGMVSP